MANEESSKDRTKDDDDKMSASVKGDETLAVGENKKNTKVSGANDDKRSSKSAKGAVPKLRMPSGQLGNVSRAQTRLYEALQCRGATEAALAAFHKYECELARLKSDCETAILAAPQHLCPAAQEWISKNVEDKERYLAEAREQIDVVAAMNQAQHLQVPRINVIRATETGSVASRASRASSISEARKLAAAEEAALIVEKQRMERRYQQEEEERRLQAEHEERLRMLRKRIEKEDLDARLKQARVRQAALSEVDASSQFDGMQDVSHAQDARGPELPSSAQPVQAWLERLPSPFPEQQRRDDGRYDQSVQHALLQRVLLPATALTTFGGDPLKFLWFLREFETSVEKVTPDADKRLHLLLQHLEGDPYKLVAGCQLYPDPSEGYHRAKAKLIAKYGNPVRQGLIFKQQLLEWSTLRKDSADDLENFSIHLQLCQEVRIAQGAALELNDLSTLLLLMGKLPQKQQQGWQRRVCKVEERGRAVKFDDFVEYVRELAEASNHPVFGSKHVPRSKERSLATVTSSTDALTLATAATREADSRASIAEQQRKEDGRTRDAPKNALTPPCLLCQDKEHSTNKCPEAPKISIEERREALRGLCFGCLKPGHPVRWCSERAVCSVCSKTHPTVLHVEAGKALATLSPPKSSKSAVIAVVPVTVWLHEQAKVVVNAVLDPGSTTTFISAKLLKKLHVFDASEDRSTSATSMKLTTLTTDQVIDTVMLGGLHLGDLHGNVDLNLPPVFAIPNLPFQASDLPSRSDVERWPHLADLPFVWG